MKKIFFETKEESNRRREADFLKLEPIQRLLLFLQMVTNSNIKSDKDKSSNWILYKKKNHATI